MEKDDDGCDIYRIEVSLHSPESSKDGRLGYYAYEKPERIALRLHALCYMPIPTFYADAVFKMGIDDIIDLAINLRRYIEILDDVNLSRKPVRAKVGGFWSKRDYIEIELGQILSRVVHADILLCLKKALPGANDDGVQQHALSAFEVSTKERHATALEEVKKSAVSFDLLAVCQAVLYHEPSHLNSWLKGETWPVDRNTDVKNEGAE